MKTIVAALVLIIAAQSRPDVDLPKVSMRDFKRMASAQKILIVDVRPFETFREGHIPRAISLPFTGSHWPAEYDKTIALLKATAKPVVVYCACHGETLSIRVAGLLAEEGVKDPRVLVGGWNVWFNDGNRVAIGPK